MLLWLVDPDGSRHEFGYRTFASWEQAGSAEPVTYGSGSRVLARTTCDTKESVPGEAFGANGRGFLRLSFAASDEAIREGIARIGDELRD